MPRITRVASHHAVARPLSHAELHHIEYPDHYHGTPKNGPVHIFTSHLENSTLTPQPQGVMQYNHEYNPAQSFAPASHTPASRPPANQRFGGDLTTYDTGTASAPATATPNAQSITTPKWAEGSARPNTPRATFMSGRAAGRESPSRNQQLNVDPLWSEASTSSQLAQQRSIPRLISDGHLAVTPGRRRDLRDFHGSNTHSIIFGGF